MRHNHTLTRHPKITPHARQDMAALNGNHPAVAENRTLFPSTVVSAEDAPRALVEGVNSRKIGQKIQKGPWAGMPVYTLTLEERATCPPCGLKAECYGNGMHFARRLATGPKLVEVLDLELRWLARQHRKGFAVRVHILGDFYSLEYLRAWVRWMRDIPQLHVWGYTAHEPDSQLGGLVEEANQYWPDRWVIRFSRNPAPATVGVREVTTIWRETSSATVPEGTICPASRDATACCATCALCWAPEMADTRIVFIGHGRRLRGEPATAPTPEDEQAATLLVDRNSREYRAGYASGYQAGRRKQQKEPAHG